MTAHALSRSGFKILVTVDALESQLLRVLIVVEVGGASFFRNSLWKKVLMAIDAGFVVHEVHRIFQLSLAFPVKGSTVFEMVG